MKKDIPMKVRWDDDTFSEDIDDILNTWKSDFDHLYNEPDPSYLEFDDTFLHDKISERIAYELNTGDDTLDNELYNSDFASEELDSVCTQLKKCQSSWFRYDPEWSAETHWNESCHSTICQ